MTTTLRSELEPLPSRLQTLPLDARGYVVPWFVAWVDGQPEFRAMDARKWVRAVRERRCWVCGQDIGKWLVFVIGPMCGINRTTAEPPCHRECAEWSVRNCPFLSRPEMRRREAGLPEDVQAPAGEMISRNPGVTLLWTTKTYRVFNDGRGKPLIEIGEAASVAWWADGRPATRAEVAASVDSGLPLLRAQCNQEASADLVAQAHQELTRRAGELEQIYPAA